MAVPLSNYFCFRDIYFESHCLIDGGDCFETVLESLWCVGYKCTVISILELQEIGYRGLSFCLEAPKVKKTTIQAKLNFHAVIRVLYSMTEKSDCCEKDVEDDRSQDTPLHHSNFDIEGLRFVAADFHLRLHIVMQILQDVDEFGWGTKFGESIPQQLTINSVKSFGQINESNIKIAVLLMTFFLQLSGDENHITSAPIPTKATL